MRARQFLYKVLIPERRFQEAENLELYLGAWVFVHISFIMIAMVHALFSQYFYLPFLFLWDNIVFLLSSLNLFYKIPTVIHHCLIEE